MPTNPLEDEHAIRHLVAAYADAVNRRDGDLWASTWADNSTWVLRGNPFEGKATILDTWHGAMGSFEFVVQLVYQGTLEVDGERATGRWYLTEHLRPQGSDEGRYTVGVYEDEYVKESGTWLFSKRSYEVLYEDETNGRSPA
ncbi:MAG: nuclear transport factor 2 family protein [Pseudomonadales bacterium]|nr:nuclear transport factor 2 family protein [Pseudomonadales bacterium]